MSKEVKYWKGLDEKAQDAAFVEQAQKEFPHELPSVDQVSDKITETAGGRRDFLKMLGFSVTAATVASCTVPVRKSIPYAIKPEEVTPGMPLHYASTYFQGGNYASVLVRTREGRPILIEGNKSSKVTKGGTGAMAQASVLGLYYKGRYKTALHKNKAIDWATADASIGKKLADINAKGGKTVVLTSTIISPTAKSVVNDFVAANPSAQHITYDAISYDGLLSANEQSFGERAFPSYAFDKADVIVGIGADFIGGWGLSNAYEVDWAKRRKVGKGSYNMSRHYQVASVPSITSTNADHRILVKPTEEALAVVAIYNALAGTNYSTGGFDASKVKTLVADLKAAKHSLVVCGVNDVNVQLLVNGINQMLGNYGSTININKPAYIAQGNDAAVTQLVADMQAGKVDAVLLGDVNPVYNHGASAAFVDGLKKVGLTVSFATNEDETSVLCDYVLPSNHYLESWGDAEPIKGMYSITQPTISPLYQTRQFEETLLKWSGNNNGYYNYLKQNWANNIYPVQNTYATAGALWDNTVHDGVLHTNAASGNTLALPDLSAAGAAIAGAYKSAGIELKIYSKAHMGAGEMSQNPWLLELPDPVSKVTWGNYAVANPAYCKEQGLMPNFKSITAPKVKLKVDGKELELPILAQPGVPKGVLGVALGFGRTAGDNDELKRGANAAALLNTKAKGASNILTDVTVEALGVDEELAITQTHHNITGMTLGGEKTRKVVKEATLAEYKANPKAGNEDRDFIMKHIHSLYPGHEMEGHHWMLTVDLNTCNGCNACVVACHAENNVPVVGHKEVQRAHEMHWLRIDRYYTGDEENPRAVYQPMMCQHCDNAPCENVCPVSATNHSSEGLNQMAYNRCIGTRYCANNCPYKVRRFNWYDYNGGDSFTKYTTIVDNYDDKLEMLDPTTRMVLNPDVTIRSRGVMEKCSFCVQRIQAGKLKAKREGRGLIDGDVVTACQSACATGAIQFGDRNDKSSKVAQIMEDTRAFGVIEEIHTLPSVTYLTKIRNTNEQLEA